MTITTNLDILKMDAIRVYTGMSAVFPQLSKEETLYMDWAPKFNGRYAVNNSTVAFVDESGNLYVTPYTYDVIDTLCCAGYSKDNFYVPFSNWDYPKDEAAKWRMLRKKAEQAYKEEYIKDCMKYCENHGIGAISDETLAGCFKMPISGVKVKHPHFETCFYPVITNCCLDSVAEDKLGKFSTNNGRVVFVYMNGQTYVTKGYKILSELRSAGYTETELFVPFSNGEQILDPVLAARWESIHK